MNRLETTADGEQLAVPHAEGQRYFDLWNGVELTPRLDGTQAVFSARLEARGFGALLAVAAGADTAGLPEFLTRMQARATVPLRSLSAQWQPLSQQMVPVPATALQTQAPAGLVEIPAGDFDFAVGGVEIEGQTWAGNDVQYPWEDCPRRSHRRRMAMKRFFIDRTPVTNAQFKQFVDASGYRPADVHNFLRHWQQGAPLPGWDDKPVTWVALEDARAYAAWGRQAAAA